jgi:hypothetical protein
LGALNRFTRVLGRRIRPKFATMFNQILFLTKNPYNQFLTSIARDNNLMELLDFNTFYTYSDLSSSITIKLGAYGKFGTGNSESSRVYNIQFIFV